MPCLGGPELGTEARGWYIASARFAVVLPQNTCRTTFPIRLRCPGTRGLPQTGPLGHGGGFSQRCLGHHHRSVPVGSRVPGWDAWGDFGHPSASLSLRASGGTYRHLGNSPLGRRVHHPRLTPVCLRSGSGGLQ